MWSCTLCEDGFAGQGPALRRLWEDSDTSFVPLVSSL